MGIKDGTILCACGVGDRTPTRGMEDNRARMSKDNTDWSEDNVGRSGVGRASQRSSKEHIVDSPPSKKTKSLEYCVELLT